MEINLKLNFGENSLETIKYFLLYFDIINIYIPSTMYNYDTNNSGFTNFLRNTDLFQQLNYLNNQNLVNFHEFDFSLSTQQEIYFNLLELIGKLFIQYRDDLYITNHSKYNVRPDHNYAYSIELLREYNEPLKSEPLIYFLNCLSPFTIQFDTNVSSITELTHLLLSTFFDLYNNNSVATNCSFLNNLVYSYYKESDDKNQMTFTKNYIAQDCMKILLPNIPTLTIEDILDIKTKANDELIELKSYINDFAANTIKYDIESEDFIDLTQKVQLKLNNSIECFSRKCKNIKYDIAQKFITELKNPLSYSPLLISLFHNIPAHIELLSSLLLISSNVLFEYLKKTNELKNDPLYFTYKIAKRT